EQRAGRADPKRIAALLPSKSAYLDYGRIQFYDFRNQRPISTHYVVFVLQNDPGYQVRLIDLGRAESIDSLIQDYRTEIKLIVEKGQPGRQETRKMRKYGKELYRLLIQPLEAQLRNKKHLLISPDGLLHMLPLEVLIAPDEKPLLEKYELTYLASGRDIVRWEDPSAEGREAIVMADPDYDLEPGERATVVARLGIREEQLRGGVTKQLKDWNFPRLPASRDEGKEVAQFLRNARIPVQIYLGDEALEEVLLSLESPRVLHLATHGYFLQDELHRDGGPSEIVNTGIPEASWEDPSLRSGIVLAGANRSLKENRDEGLVSATKIEGLRLRGTELVVLSACDTGIGSIHNGEGVFGLKRSFVLSGVQTLILSLWKVPDQSARELMKEFYTLWSSGLNKSEALRKARLEIRKKYDNPFYWAAFQIVGNPN
ncbi:CHAT domain-containing protein, partial [bacterium]|nr:CHAT domain-containing protein [bacterium]